MMLATLPARMVGGSPFVGFQPSLEVSEWIPEKRPAHALVSIRKVTIETVTISLHTRKVR